MPRSQNNILDMVELSTPPFIRQSHGLWIDVPRSALEILLLKNIHPAGSIHAAEHALLSLTPIFAMSVEGDVKTECKQPEKELARNPSTRKRPARYVSSYVSGRVKDTDVGDRLILYDSSGKSGGVCAKAFDNISDLLAQAADCIAACPCIEGCPSCGSLPLAFEVVTNIVGQVSPRPSAAVRTRSCPNLALVSSSIRYWVGTSTSIRSRCRSCWSGPYQEEVSTCKVSTNLVRVLEGAWRGV